MNPSDGGALFRRLLNREDRVGTWRLVLMRVVDPIEWYLRKHSNDEEIGSTRRTRRGRPVGWMTYGPVEGESAKEGRPGSAPPPAVSRPHPERADDAQRRLQAYMDSCDALRRECSSLFETMARELLAGGEPVIETTVESVRAKLVRLRNGAVLVLEHATQAETGRGMTRVERRQLADPIPLLVSYLIGAVAELGPNARPLPPGE